MAIKMYQDINAKMKVTLKEYSLKQCQPWNLNISYFFNMLSTQWITSITTWEWNAKIK